MDDSSNRQWRSLVFKWSFWLPLIPYLISVRGIHIGSLFFWYLIFNGIATGFLCFFLFHLSISLWLCHEHFKKHNKLSTIYSKLPYIYTLTLYIITYSIVIYKIS